MGWLLDDLRNAPTRKASAKRAAQDRAIFRQVCDFRTNQLAAKAKQTDEDRELIKGVDWGVEIEE